MARASPLLGPLISQTRVVSAWPVAGQASEAEAPLRLLCLVLMEMLPLLLKTSLRPPWSKLWPPASQLNQEESFGSTG